MLGTWGASWMGYGLLNGLFATGRLAAPRGPFLERSFWFIALAAIPWVGAAAATAESGALAAAYVLFAAGSTLAAIAAGVNAAWVTMLAGGVFIVGSVGA
jgi:uncharacterized protein